VKKLLSLLGAFGLLVTSSSSVIACNQEAKQPNDSQNPSTKKTQLSLALPKTDLDIIHVESTEKPKEKDQEETPEDVETQDQELNTTFNLSTHIVKRLIEINGQEKTGVNPFELYVGLPTLINKFGDMKATVEVYNHSKTHEGQIEVTFKIDIDNEYLIRETNLGTFTGEDVDQFMLIDNIPVLKDEFLIKRIIDLNPSLIDSRFKDRIKRKELIST